ncbi:hypothetical protein DL96DRAFT_939535 [Flagelloscypha sp. PMI_526]|nr:hypothetical protein DL96DRAFT_939535 [Flagelloscypha sp. PMI_526]
MSRVTRGSRSFLAIAVLLLTTAMTAHGLYQGFPSRSGLVRRQDSDIQDFSDSFTAAPDNKAEASTTGGADSQAESSTTSPSETETETETSKTSTSTSLASEIATSLNSTSTTPLSTSTTPTTTSSTPPTTSHSSTRRRTSSVGPQPTPEPIAATTLVVSPFPFTSTVPVTTEDPTNIPTAVGASSDVFWDNKSAVGGTFGAVGVVAVGVLGVIVFGLVRKHRTRDEPARDTIIWNDKDEGPYPQRSHSPTHSVEAMVSQTPMDAFSQSRDPFQTLNDGALAYHAQPYINEPTRTPSVYSENMAGYGTAAPRYPPSAPQPQHNGHDGYAFEAYTSVAATTPTNNGGLAPPTSRSASRPSFASERSLDSFYEGYEPHSAGQAI